MKLSGLKQSGRQFLWITGAWIIVAFLISILSFIAFSGDETSTGWLFFFLFELACIAPWPVFTPAIIWLFRRYDFKESKRIQSIFVHLCAMLITFSIHMLVQSTSMFWFFEEPFDVAYLKVDFVGFLDMRIAFYAGIILAVSALDFYKKDRENSLREPQLRAAIHRIRFQDLKNQMQPKFLLHTLDVVAQNLEKRPDFAEELVADLSDLLRVMLENYRSEEVLLYKDFEHLKLFLDILNKKTDSFVLLERDVDPECFDVLVPTVFYIIPLFEAIHQYSSTETGGLEKIRYGARCHDGKLCLSAILVGAQISVGQLHNIQQQTGFYEIIDRLDHIYSSSYTLDCIQVNEGLKVALKLPLKRAGEERHPSGKVSGLYEYE